MGTSPLHSPWWNYPNNPAPRALPLSTQHLLIVHHCTVDPAAIPRLTWPPGRSRVGLIGTFLLFWVTMSSDFLFSEQNRCLLCSTIKWWIFTSRWRCLRTWPLLRVSTGSRTPRARPGSAPSAAPSSPGRRGESWQSSGPSSGAPWWPCTPPDCPGHHTLLNSRNVKL